MTEPSVPLPDDFGLMVRFDSKQRVVTVTND